MDFEQKAMRGLDRLPKLSPEVWDRQGVERYSGDQRRSPFKGAQTVSAAELGEALLSAIDRKYGSLRNAFGYAKLQRVSFASLTGVQAAVSANKVAAKIHEIAKTDELAAPTVARFKGKKYLIDGYHTLTALKLGGVRQVQAFVIQL